jgi:polysaccharide chain length determinant protein (PEP-CTERM system associated)
MQEFLEIFRSTIRGMWTHRWAGLATGIAVGLLGILISYLIPSRYEATARVYVDTQSLLRPVLKEMAVQPNVEQQVAMMGRIILSRPNVDKVMKASDLDLRVKGPGEREKFIDDLIKEIEFKAAAGSPNLYQIAYKNEKPESAKAVVQSLLGIFIEQGYGGDRDNADKAIRFLNEQIKDAEQKLLLSETALKDFKIKNLNLMPELQRDTIAQGATAQNALSQARLELRQAEYARDSLRNQLKDESSTLPSNEVAASSSNDNPGPSRAKPTELDERLESTRRRLDELRTKYTEEHPDVIGLRRIIAQMEEQKASEKKIEDAKPPAVRAQAARAASVANPVFQQIKLSLAETEAQVAALRARVSDYESRVSQSRETALTIPKVEAEYLQLSRDYENIKKSYDNLLGRRTVAELSGAVGASSGVAEYKVVDPPRVSSKPVWPNRPLLLSLAFLASIAAGLATCFMRDQVKPTFYDVRSLRQATGIPLLGSISYIIDSAAKARAGRQKWLFTGITGGYFLAFTALLVWMWLRTVYR